MGLIEDNFNILDSYISFCFSKFLDILSFSSLYFFSNFFISEFFIANFLFKSLHSFWDSSNKAFKSELYFDKIDISEDFLDESSCNFFTKRFNSINLFISSSIFNLI